MYVMMVTMMASEQPHLDASDIIAMIHSLRRYEAVRNESAASEDVEVTRSGSLIYWTTRKEPSESMNRQQDHHL
jgi:hypothetical protein